MIIKMYLFATTSCFVLQITPTNRLKPHGNDVASAAVLLWMTVCAVAARWLGLTKHENTVIVLPFSWFSAKTMQLALLKLGLVPRKVTTWAGRRLQIGSLALFFIGQVMTHGLMSGIVLCMLIWEVITMVRRWVRPEVRGSEDTEKGLDVLEPEKAR